LESGEETDEGKLWFIPLFIRTDSGEQYFELTETNTTIKIQITSKDSYVKINSKGKSFVRVIYGDESMKRIISAAKQGLLSASDNAVLLSDATSLMKSEKISFEGYIQMMTSFTNISNTETLDMIKMNISTIKK